MKLQAQRIVLWSTAWLAIAGLGLGDGLRRVSAFLMCRLTLNGNSVELRCRDEVVLVQTLDLLGAQRDARVDHRIIVKFLSEFDEIWARVC